MNLFIYDIKTKRYLRSESGNPNWILMDVTDDEDFTLVKPPDNTNNWKWLDNEWVLLEDINNPDTPYSSTSVWDNELGMWVDDAELLAYKHMEDINNMWERIKNYRHMKTTSGVYIPSIDSHLHTDETSVMIYATIGNAIMSGVYESENWKTMEGSFVKMDENLYKELQTAMMQNTRKHYERAEYHKYMMSKSDNPLEYNYTENW